MGHFKAHEHHAEIFCLDAGRLPSLQKVSVGIEPGEGVFLRGAVAGLILEKAEKALNTAKAGGRSQIYSFRQILTQGGMVLEVMPMNRLIINLGLVHGRVVAKNRIALPPDNGFAAVELAGPDQKALPFVGIHAPAEVSLVEVQEEMSIAEVLVQSDPNWTVEKGDKLTLLDDHTGRMEQREVGEFVRAEFVRKPRS